MLTLNSELAIVDAILLTVGIITDSEDVATSVLCNWAQRANEINANHVPGGFNWNGMKLRHSSS